MVKSFLEIVAQDVYGKWGHDLKDTAIIFPNKRAGLFFEEYLSRCCEGDLWSPRYLTISDLFRSEAKGLQVTDNIELVCDLYKIYQESPGTEETLDEFFFWGETLLADFDDVDKNLAFDTDAENQPLPPNEKNLGKAKLLFQNLQDLKEIETDFLTDEQKVALEQFFKNFKRDKSETLIKKRFNRVWDNLASIYLRLRTTLYNKGVAYEGMLERIVVEELQPEKLPLSHYIFVGFNVLNTVESTLFSKMKNAGKAHFYFDYDESYLTEEHEAGTFLRSNILRFGNELSRNTAESEGAYTNAQKPKKIRFVSSVTENGQARMLPSWIERHTVPPTEDNGYGRENAIVLCNELLLGSVIHSLHCNKYPRLKVNVTMGYPLTQTPAFSFITSLYELHTGGYTPNGGRYYFKQVSAVLRHPYIRTLFPEQADALLEELISKNRFLPSYKELSCGEVLTPDTINLAYLFQDLGESKGDVHELQLNILQYILKLIGKTAQLPQANKGEDFNEQLYAEALFKGHQTVSRIRELVENNLLEVNNYMLGRLLEKVLSGISIPFHGEPAIGLQVMGVLETRNLDFSHLILLSVNEKQLPKSSSDTSFIPYHLRKAFGLTTLEKKNAVYAYYFYRLMQRAEDITLVYNSSTSGMNTGEMSRFMLQYLVESPHRIEQYYLRAGSDTPEQGELFADMNAEENTEAVVKTEKMMAQLWRRCSGKSFLSPTALNSYLNCPLQFYFKYIAGLTVVDEVSEDIESNDFGTMFHKTAELIYKEVMAHPELPTEFQLSKLLKDPVHLRITQWVDQSFREEFFHLEKQESLTYNGLQLLNRQAIIHYICRLLELDRNTAEEQGLRCTHTEEEVHFGVKLANGKEVRIGGVIDRQDIVGEKGDPTQPAAYRIIDYKTGKKASSFNSIEELFSQEGKGGSKHVFQTFLYACIKINNLIKKYPEGIPYRIEPHLFYTQELSNPEFESVIKMGKKPIQDFMNLYDEYMTYLKQLLEEIFDPTIPLEPTEKEEHCTYCDFANICTKKK
jgi:hypothetical protein